MRVRGDRKTASYRLRCTEQERERWHEQANMKGMILSDYIKYLIENDKENHDKTKAIHESIQDS